uniref:B-cell scaffold protein with ankyrin repeats-like isoform X2 n=1 Tax=Oncorhynchus gorbuscha TaxID=8017 RepID=UPI001EAF8884|nr:B-cell scaffold protein with ankyrin repeats-like isoform X2 [Oncorhynchus gorbuscha]
MSSAEDLLIIYEVEAEQWAVYLRSIFAGPIWEGGICCYDIATVTSRREDFLRLGQYKVKLLILSRGMLEGLCQLRRFFLARVLRPAAHVVVLLCGVDSLAPLLEVVPLKGDECLQVSSEQDAHEYLSAVTDIVQRGHQAAAGNVSAVPGKLMGPDLKLELNLKLESRQSTGPSSTKPNNMLLVPSRVLCGTPGEVFILLKDSVASKDAEVEFSRSKQRVRVKPVHWNKHTLCVNAADLQAGSVGVTLYCSGVAMGKAHLQYYSSMEEMARLLTRVADPVDFMCQSLQVSSVEKLDQRLSSMLLEAMPSTGFQGLQGYDPPVGETLPEDVPSLLHFAAQNGFKDVAGVLLQCPGSKRALCTTNRQGQTPAEIAQHNGHDELHVVLQQTLNMFTVGKDSDDSSIYEMMCTAVFQKKMSQSDTETLYSLPTKQARGRDSISSTYDTFVPNQLPGLEQLIELQEKVKRGSLSMDEALERFSDWQRVQKGMDAIQQEKLRQLRASIINNREDDESVYDKINIIHHTPNVTVNECRRGSQPVETDFYSKPLKGQHVPSNKKQDI